VRFVDNKVIDPAGYGLRYTDEAHAGDDRTAPSETTKQLSDPHQHHTKVEIRGNTLVGSGIWVDVLNADDELHTQRNPAWFWITDNTVQLAQRHDGLLGTQFFGQGYDANTGIRVDTAKEMQMDIRGNTLSWQATSSSDPVADLLGSMLSQPPTPVGIRLSGVRDGSVVVAQNKGTGFTQGVAGFDMDKKATWNVAGNDFPGAANAVYYDSSVENKPTSAAAQPLADPGAWGDGAAAEPAEAEPAHHHGP
jgi:hypothetical protein